MHPFVGVDILFQKSVGDEVKEMWNPSFNNRREISHMQLTVQ